MVPSKRHLALFEQGQPLVRSVAVSVLRRLPMRTDLEDLIGYGQLGLAEAAMHFDEDRNIRFTTFAYYRIKGAIYDGVSKMSWTSRGRLNRLRLRQDRESSETAEQGDDNLTAGQLARVFLTNGYDPGENSARHALAEDSAGSPLARAMNREVALKLNEIVKELPRLPRVLIESIYYDGATLQQVADRLGISKSWASRVHAQTLQQLALVLRRMGMD